METKEMTLVTPKETTEVGEALRELIRNIAIVNKENGANWLKFPRIVKRSFAELVVAIRGMGDIKGELAEDPTMAVAGVINNVLFGIHDILEIMNEDKSVATVEGCVRSFNEKYEEEIAIVMKALDAAE